MIDLYLIAKFLKDIIIDIVSIIMKIKFLITNPK